MGSWGEEMWLCTKAVPGMPVTPYGLNKRPRVFKSCRLALEKSNADSMVVVTELTDVTRDTQDKVNSGLMLEFVFQQLLVITTRFSPKGIQIAVT